MPRVLFVCSQNRLRSPTAEQIFSDWPGIECASAGTDEHADSPVDPETLQWSELIFVMERSHKARLTRKFGPHLKGKRVVVLGIPDEYEYMDPRLVKVLERKVGPYLSKFAPPSHRG